jgi:hypothetical protein
VTTTSAWPIVLRGGVVIEDPLSVVLGFLARWRLDLSMPAQPAALIPMLDSIVQKYLADDDPVTQAPFGQRALALVRGYKRDLDRNLTAVRAVRQELAGRGYDITDVRILDLLILSAADPSA